MKTKAKPHGSGAHLGNEGKTNHWSVAAECSRSGKQSHLYRERGLAVRDVESLVRIAAFQNPEFYKAQSMRLSTYGKPRVISCGEVFPEQLVFQEGAWKR